MEREMDFFLPIYSLTIETANARFSSAVDGIGKAHNIKPDLLKFLADTDIPHFTRNCVYYDRDIGDVLDPEILKNMVRDFIGEQTYLFSLGIENKQAEGGDQKATRSKILKNYDFILEDFPRTVQNIYAKGMRDILGIEPRSADLPGLSTKYRTEFERARASCIKRWCDEDARAGQEAQSRGEGRVAKRDIIERPLQARDFQSVELDSRFRPINGVPNMAAARFKVTAGEILVIRKGDAKKPGYELMTEPDISVATSPSHQPIADEAHLRQCLFETCQGLLRDARGRGR